jgi:type I restriction enzyme S subunit
MNLDTTDVRYLPGRAEDWASYGIELGDLLFTRYNGNRELVGACARVTEVSRFIVHPDKLIRVRLHERYVDGRFVEKVANVGESREFIDEKLKTSAGQVGISGTDLKDVPIPVPPLPEQRRIVARVDALTSRSRRAKEALDAVPALLEQFRRAVLASAFRGDLTAAWREKNQNMEPAEKLLARIRQERRQRWEAAELAKMLAKGKKPADDRWKEKYEEPPPVDTEGLPELPEGWCWAALEELAVLITDGDHNPPKRAMTGIAHLTAKNVKLWTLNLDGCSYVTEVGFAQTRQRYEPLRSDVIVTCVGTVGECAVVPAGLTFSADRNLAGIRLFESGMDPDVLVYLLSSPVLQERMAEASGSSAQPHIYLGDLRRLPVPLAPCAEQMAIKARVSSAHAAAMRFQHVFRSARQLATNLDRAILAKAFRGELVPQDPADEPASTLLARLRAEREQPSPAAAPARKPRRKA